MNRKLGLVLILIAIGVAGYLNFYLKTNKAKDSILNDDGITVPTDLIQCNEGIEKQDCDKIERKTVCGYDHTVYESGKEKDNVLQFKSACHYCKFYGVAGEEKDVAGTKIRGLGYEEKECDQGMYKK